MVGNIESLEKEVFSEQIWISATPSNRWRISLEEGYEALRSSGKLNLYLCRLQEFRRISEGYLISTRDGLDKVALSWVIDQLFKERLLVL